PRRKALLAGQAAASLILSPVTGRSLLFAATALVSSSLLFVVQPMLAKMVLPMLGGAPSVWNTCVVFFQVSLVVGYAYAHFLTRWLSMRPQSIAHLILLIAALAYLPLHIPAGWMPPTDVNPVGWLLLLLVVAVGLPFVLVSTTSPLVQRWFAHSHEHHPDHE